MKLEIFPLTAAPSELRQLFAAAKLPESTWSWFETLAITTLSPGEEAVIASLVERDGSFVSAIPLVLKANGASRGLTAMYTTLFQPPLGRRDHAFMLGKLLACTIRGSLWLDCLDTSDPSTSRFLDGLSQSGLVLARFQHFSNWFEKISEFETFWAARSSRLRSTVKRKTAVLSRESRLNFRHVDFAQEAQSGIAVYHAIYAKSWKAAEPHPKFIDTLMTALGPTQVAHLAIASIDGEPAAAQIWLVQSPKATIFKLAHDSKFENHSPGSLLTHWLLKEFCTSAGVREVDFGRGDDAYKREWLHDCRFRHGIVGANPRSLRGMRSLLVEVAPTKFSSLLRFCLSKLRPRLNRLDETDQ